MRTRSLFTTVACTMVLAGAGAGTAFADDTSGQPTTMPSTPAASSAPSAAPATMPSAARSASPVTSAPPAPTRTGDGQIRAVPSGAPNTGVPTDTSNGHGAAEAAGAGLVLLLGGSGGVMLRRRLKGRG